MLIFDFRVIGNKLLGVRKRLGLTQAEVAEEAGLSDRTYADIERGSVNMRLESFLRICKVLHISPDTVLAEDDNNPQVRQRELMDKLAICNSRDQETALQLLSVYLESLDKE